MLQKIKISTALFSAFLLNGCQSMPQKDAENTSSIKTISIPPVTSKVSINPNELMYTFINQISAIVLRPKEVTTIHANLPLMNYQVTVNQNSLFYKGKSSDGKKMICSVGSTLKPTIGPLEPFCLVEAEKEGLFNKVLIGASFHYPIKTPNVPEFIEDEITFNPNGSTKREIYFSKVENNNLFFIYKEYKDKALTKTQPFIFPVQKTPFLIKIKEAEFLITDINKNLEFKVLKEMNSTISNETQVKCLHKSSGASTHTRVNSCANLNGIAFPP